MSTNKQSIDNILYNLYVSDNNADVRSKLKAFIGSDPSKLINALANFLGYEKISNGNLAGLVIESHILDGGLQKFLQSLINIKATNDTLLKDDFTDLFYTMIQNSVIDTYMIKSQIQEIINYFGYSLSYKRCRIKV